MSAEKKIDRMDVAFADQSDAYRVLFDLVGDHPRASEIMILIQQYGSRCADAAEAKAAYVAMEPTEDTVTTENRLDITDERLSGIGKVLSNQTERLVAVGGILSDQNKQLDKIKAKFVAAAQVVEERNQRLRVLETTLAASEDARENVDMRISSLAANINNHMQRIDGLEANLRVITEKEAEDETNRQLEEDTQKAILSGKQ